MREMKNEETRVYERKRDRGKAREKENARITLWKKKHPEPPLSHILAYPMVANMAGSGAQRRVRVSASEG
jgi:hypothetical protein